MPILRGVRDRRRKTGVKLGPFSAELGCSRSHLNSVENGYRPASYELAVRIADKLGCDVSDLLPAGESVPDEPPPQPKPAPKPPPRRKEKAPRPKRPESVRGVA